MSFTSSDALITGRCRHPRPRGRLLAVSIWLGAGAITLGVGAGLASACGVAQADTGGHSGTGSSSAHKPAAKSSAGPKIMTRSHVSRTAAATSAKRSPATALSAATVRVTRPSAVATDATDPEPSVGVSATTRRTRATTARVNTGGPATAPGSPQRAVANGKTSVNPATEAVTPTAAVTRGDPTTQIAPSTTQTIDTPFGPVTLTVSADVPDPFTSGPVAVDAKASTPLGNASFSLTGTQSSTTEPGRTPATVAEIALSEGTLVVPAPISLLADALGPVVTGGASLSNSANAFIAAQKSGDIPGAITAFLAAGVNFGNAVLFGQYTVAVPIGSTEGQSVEVRVPFAGIFGSLRPLSVSVPDYSYTDDALGVGYQIDAADISFDGAKFGGIVPGFLKAIGL